MISELEEFILRRSLKNVLWKITFLTNVRISAKSANDEGQAQTMA